MGWNISKSNFWNLYFNTDILVEQKYLDYIQTWEVGHDLLTCEQTPGCIQHNPLRDICKWKQHPHNKGLVEKNGYSLWRQ